MIMFVKVWKWFDRWCIFFFNWYICEIINWILWNKMVQWVFYNF